LVSDIVVPVGDAAAASGGSPGELDRDAWPLYLQVAGMIRQAIQSGELSGRLDSIAVLAKRYGVSVKTIRNALAVLTDEGLVRGFAGSGTFVVPPSERL
jgi:GntR family transcriptional regulator